MSEHIVVATDFSAASVSAYREAARIARKLEARVTLVHVDELEASPVYAPTDSMTGYREHLGLLRDEALKEARYFFSERGVEVKYILLRSEQASEAIIREAEQTQATMIVVAKQGVRLVDRLLLGSTSQRLVRHASTPILVVPRSDEEPSPSSEHLLVATDFSEPSRRGLGVALSLSMALGATLEVVHVVQPPVFAAPTAADPPIVVPHELTDALEQHAREALEPLLEQYQSYDFDARVHVGFDVVETLLSAAEARETSMIVVPTHGKSRFQSVLLGSVSQALLRSSTRPVLVLPRAFLERYEAA